MYCSEQSCFNYSIEGSQKCFAHVYNPDILDFSFCLDNILPKNLLRCMYECFNPEEIYYFSGRWHRIGVGSRANFAAKNGFLDLLKWTPRDQFYDFHVCGYAAFGGHQELLEWALNQDFDRNRLCASAANGGQLDLLKWMEENGHLDFDLQACAKAAQNGDLEILKWLRLKGFHWDEYTVENAACFGHLEILQWAFEEKCPLHHGIFARTAKHGHLHILQYLHEKTDVFIDWKCCEQSSYAPIANWAKSELTAKKKEK